MNWTSDQEKAIKASGENILLAAAAGSGKTAVLVERIINMITDEKRNIDVNRLLVLTYTEAAAKEMKNKISDAIEEKLEEFPDNERLKKQRLLLNSANISTIHAFCLEMLKANIHLTNIPMDFSICSENESSLMLSECIDEILSEYYLRLNKLSSFRAIADGYGGNKSDSELRTILASLYKFAVSMTDPVKWLNDTANEHKKVYESKTIINTVWDRELKRNIYNLIERIEEAMEAELSYCEEYLDDFVSGSMHKYTEFFTVENTQISNTLKMVKRELELESEDRYDKVSELFAGISFDRLVTVRCKDCPEMKPFMERAKLYREIIKKEVQSVKDILSMTQEVMTERICINYPRVKTLKNIVIRIMRRFKREKLRKGLLDFNDLEHEMLNLIRNRNGTPTEAAEALRKRYIEILVDEYQDTNYIQDAIFKTISRNNKNIFMVGDMKQSIYMFRNAVPKLFLEKYNSYVIKNKAESENNSKENQSGRLIRLNKNFRSRREVIDTVNFVFEGLMSEKLGDIDYKDDEKLDLGADYPKCVKNEMDTELIIVENTEEYGINNYELEAKAAALKIKQMVGSFEVSDKESGAMRKAEYKDIVILIRNANSLASVYENVFSEYGVPIYTGAGRTYLSSVEVRTVLAFLQIIDNPYQDIPLVAVMRSPMFAFTADELARIRSTKRKGYFYDALIETVRLGGFEKADKFLKEIISIRVNNERLNIHSLIWDIYYKYNYFSIVGAMDMGNTRQENLRLLYNRAVEFENSRFEGLFEFMNYIDNMVENGKDLAAVSDVGENANVVTLMSIHKSKGLEFPIVLLCGTSKEFNSRDISKPVMWNDKLGISLKCYDYEIRALYPSVTADIMAKHITSNQMSEEMRLLYVALTRAKEKLIIFAPIGGRGSSWKKVVLDRNNKIINSYKMSLHSMRDWILSVFMLHKDAGCLRLMSGIDESIVDFKADFNLNCFAVSDAEIISGCADLTGIETAENSETAENRTDIEETSIAEIAEYSYDMSDISEKLFKKYKFKNLGKIPVKISVTELKRMKNEALDELDGFNGGENEINIFDKDFTGNELRLKSDNMSTKHLQSDAFKSIDSQSFKRVDEISGASRGTIVHFVMQHIDFKTINSVDDVNYQIAEMIKNGMLDKEQADNVTSDMILNFASSELCRRMNNSNDVKKEFKFYTTVSPSEIYEDYSLNGADDENILMQGIADCFFEEDGEFVLIDYKTDNVYGKDIIKYSERYRPQLEYYRKAIEKIFEKRVKEKYIYYLDCAKSIEIK